MMRKMFLTLLVGLSLSLPLSAAGGQEEEGYEAVEGLENWSHEFDISELKEGKYNLIIRGKDKAGNVYYEGPINLYVDPASDLPVTSISNPRQESRVGGNLYIVGTCVDDDEVSFVEVKIDEGEYRKAEGTDFWSFFVDSDSLPDGQHAITARGTDINGVVGNEITTVFHLDTTKPLNQVTSHENGVFVSGKLNLEGIVNDANGVESLSYSMDGGSTFEPLKVSYDKAEDLYTFKLSINTTKMKDGPAVYWLRAEDRTGSIGYASFLFFVDNTKPVLDILTPLPDEGVNGIVTVAGKVTDRTGVKMLSYDAGEGNTGAIELTPGNPYWAKTFDFSKITKDRHQIVFSMEDNTGNSSEYKYTLSMDHEADLPVVSVSSPVPDGKIQGDVRVSGFVSDDDGVKEVVYSIDKEAGVSVPATEAFLFSIPDLRPGEHRLTIHAVDSFGVQGPSQEIEFVKVGPAPRISFDGVKSGDAEEPFRPGVEVWPLAKNTISGSVVSSNGIRSAEYRIGGGEAEKLSVGKGEQQDVYTFTVPVPEEVPYGIVNILVRVVDEFEQEKMLESFIHVTNLSKRRLDPQILFSDARIASDGTVRLFRDQPLSGIMAGERVRSVRTVPEQSLVSVTSDGEKIVVRSAGAGSAEPCRIEVVTEKGHIYQSREFRFVTDEKAPQISLVSPRAGVWVQGEVRLEGRLSDDVSLVSLEYSLDGGESYRDLELQTGDGRNGEFSSTISLAGTDDGLVVIDLRASDNAGNTSLARTVVLKDTQEPLLSLLVPEEGATVNDRLSVFGTTVDEGLVAKVEVSLDGETFTPLSGTSEFSYEVDLTRLAELPPFVTFRVTDRSGNVSHFMPPLTLTQGKPPARQAPAVEGGEAQPDKERPAVSVLSHTPGTKTHGTVTLAGTVTDNEGVRSLSCTFADVTEEIPLGEGSPYWVKEFDLSRASGSKAQISFTAVDRNGNEGKLSFSLARDEATDAPAVEVLLPAEKTSAEAPLFAYGRIFDDEGIRGISWAIDEDSPSFLSAEDAFVLDLTTVPAGSHTLRVIPVDENGIEGKVVEVPFTLIGAGPHVEVGSYLSGKEPFGYSPGMLLPCDEGPVLSGRVVAENPLKAVEYAILPLAGDAPESWSKASFKKGDVESLYDILVPLPKSLAYSGYRILIRAEDEFGKTGEYESFFFNVKPVLQQIRDDEEILFLDERIESGGVVRLAHGEMLRGYYNGRPIRSIELLPETPLVSVSADGNFISLSAVRGGISEPLTLKLVTADGDEFSWGPFSFITDAVPPALDIVSPRLGEWRDGEMVLSGAARDRETEIVDLAWSLNGGSFLPVPVITPSESGNTAEEPGAAEAESAEVKTPLVTQGLREDGSFTLTVPLTVAGDGNVELCIRSEDTAGNSSEKYVLFKKDTREPSISLIAPPRADRINGLTTLVGKVTDAGRVTAVEFSDDGVNYSAVSGNFVFFQDVDFSKYMDTSRVAVPEPAASEKDALGDGNSVPEGSAAGEESAADARGTDASGADSSGDSASQAGEPGNLSLPQSILERISFRAHDRSGNTGTFSPRLNLDQDSDIPEVQIQIPAEGEVIRNDFTISGLVFDDDGGSTIYFRLDDQEFRRIEGESSFSVPVSLEEVSDNEHTIEVKAVDRGGVESEVARSTFRISLEEPSSRLLAPRLDQTVHETITLRGESEDANGIAEVFLSFDNGNTFFRAEGRERWHYDLNTRLLMDGTYSVMVKAVDNYGTEGIYATLLSLDNTPPDIVLDSPANGEVVQNSLRLEGRVSDNRGLASLQARLTPLRNPGQTGDAPAGAEAAGGGEETIAVAAEGSAGNAVPEPVLVPDPSGEQLFPLQMNEVFSEEIETDGLAPGWYNLRLEATDHADNRQYFAKNIRIEAKKSLDRLEIIYPGEGKEISGHFTLQGRVVSDRPVTSVNLVRDGAAPEALLLDEFGCFRYELGPDMLTDGTHTFLLKHILPDNTVLQSDVRTIEYSRSGPWVKIDSHGAGSYVTDRPYLEGRAGYYLDPPEGDDKETRKEFNRILKQHRVERVEVSLDNGRSFQNAGGKEQWKFRLETQDYPDGKLMVLVKAVFADGGSAVTSTHLVVDDRPPEVTLLNLEENGRFNQLLPIMGTARDENGLMMISANLRQGDKSSYEVPEFIQGLYIDTHFLGNTYFDIGAGLTFFDDNVKIQGQFGKTRVDPLARFSGSMIGAKLLANVARVPFRYFLGPDWEWLSLSMAVGANFSYVTMSSEGVGDSGGGLVLAAVLGQLEFPIITLDSLEMFNTYSMYTEFQLWFISSDVDAGFMPKLSIGARFGVF